MKRARKQKRPPLYVVHRNQEGYYHHAEIALVLPSEYSDRYQETDLRLTWQADPKTQGWYAFRIELKVRSPQEVAWAMGILRRIWGKESQGVGFFYSAEKALEDLERAGFVQGAYDPRLHEYVALKDWPSPELARWGEDFQALGAESLMAAVLAKDAETARTLIAKELAEQAVSDRFNARRYAERLAAWIAAGRPVQLLEEGRKPPAPARELLRLEWAKPETGTEPAAEAEVVTA